MELFTVLAIVDTNGWLHLYGGIAGEKLASLYLQHSHNSTISAISYSGSDGISSIMISKFTETYYK